MRLRLVASTFTIFGTALATVLISAPAQASISAADTGHSVTMRSNEVGAITGVVDGAGGKALTGACVVASGPGGSTLAVTASDGRYTLNGLRAGRYTVRYSACAAPGHYADQWWGGTAGPDGAAKEGAAKVSIAAGQVRELATVTLRAAVPSAPALPPAIARLSFTSAIPGLTPQAIAASAHGQASGGTGAIAGTVTGGGKALSGICVFALGPHSARARTSAAGKYLLTKLKAGRYEVIFIPAGFCGRNTGNWLEQVYKNDNGPRFGKPTRVPVKAGKTTSGIDAALRLGGEITGTVKSQAGHPLSRVCVEAQGRDGKDFVDGDTVSNKHGGYVLHSLFPGKYVVAFIPRDCGSSGNFIPQWWRNSATAKNATKITIASGQIVEKINGALRPGAIISGVVRGGSTHGALLKGICVFAEPTKRTGRFFDFFRVVTNSKGAYRLIGLSTGKYRLFYLRDCGNKGNFLEVKRTISVVAGHARNGVDTVLPVGAIISGKVTDTHGQPITGICVSVSGHGFSAARTAADGTYSAIALPTGSYKVAFSGGCKSTGSFAPQFYRGQVNRASADPVTATAGHTTGGINAVMRPGGTITGVVTDASGNKLNRLCIEVQTVSQAQEGFPYGDIVQTKNGVYTVRNLMPGDYAVSFGCPFGRQLFASQWFRGQPGQGSADYVSAPAGRITSGVSAVMRSGGSIAGTVTSAGHPVRGICVEAVPHGESPTDEFIFFGRSFAVTNRSGVYHLSHLAAGKYDIEFSCVGNRFASQWYKGTASRAAATPVTVTNNTATTGIDAVMAAGGSISGLVTTGAGHPRGRICVVSIDSNDASFHESITNKQGRYTTRNLPSGSYQITFFDCGGGKGHVRLGTAILPRLVKLTAPHAVTVPAEKMVPAGSISGTVLGGSGATPQSGVCVVAVAEGTSVAIDSASTSSAGTYKFGDLAPGSYNIYLGDPSCNQDNFYAPQWYRGASSQATATSVKVISGSDTAGINATLGGVGTITGVVTAHGHKPVAGACVTATPADPVADPVFDAVPHPVVAISAGSYVLTGLVPGKYTVEFSAGCGATGLRAQWWHNAGSAGKATVITVPPSGTVNGISANLH